MVWTVASWLYCLGALVWLLIGATRLYKSFKAYQRGYAAGYEAALAIEKRRWVSDAQTLLSRLSSLSTLAKGGDREAVRENREATTEGRS